MPNSDSGRDRVVNIRGAVYLFDVDNTLFDNDRFGADFGGAEHDRYWRIYGRIREQLGYADYLSAVQQFRAGLESHPRLLELAAHILDYPFDAGLFPQALEAVARLGQSGVTAILSDGDMVLQPRKIRRSGIWDAVQGRVLIDIHKERELGSLQLRFPAQHYVMIDDKPQILAAMKTMLGPKLTTVFVKQGHYALASTASPPAPAPDVAIDRISDLLNCNLRTAQVAP
jgi:FMN phosphatase YigB (HAD superfamily)